MFEIFQHLAKKYPYDASVYFEQFSSLDPSKQAVLARIILEENIKLGKDFNRWKIEPRFYPEICRTLIKHDISEVELFNNIYLQHEYTRQLLKHELDMNDNDPLVVCLIKMRNPRARLLALDLIKKYSFKLKDKKPTTPADLVFNLGVENVYTRKDLKDDRLQQEIVITGHALITSSVRPETLRIIHEKVGKEKGSLAKINALKKVSAIRLLEGNFEADKSLDNALEEAFRRKIDIPVSGLSRKYLETIGCWRDPSALFAYYSKVLETREPEVLNDFKTYLTEVLEGTFQQNRVRNLSYPKGWVEGASKPARLDSLVGTFNFAKFLRTKIDDNHLPEDIARNVLPYLDNFQKPLSSELSELERELVLLTREGVGHLTALQNLLSKTDYPLKNDVNGWISQTKHVGEGAGNYTLVDSDTPCDFLLMGTEVYGSCQNIHGDANLNKALLGTMLSGSNRLILLKNSNGKIAGRGLMRLVQVNGKQALFLERYYPDTLSKEAKEAMDDFAKERSRALKLPLFTDARPEVLAEKGTLTSLPGRGKYQYTDAGGGVKTAPYTIMNFYPALSVRTSA